MDAKGKTQTAVCKFACTGITDHGHSTRTVKLETRYDDTLPDDQRFSRATPYGAMEFGLQNPALEGFFAPGATYYIEIRKAG